MEPLIVEEDVVVLMVMFQNLEQGLLGLRGCSRKCVGAQDRGRKPRRSGEKALSHVCGWDFGSSRLVSREKVSDRRSHSLLLLHF